MQVSLSSVYVPATLCMRSCVSIGHIKNRCHYQQHILSYFINQRYVTQICYKQQTESSTQGHVYNPITDDSFFSAMSTSAPHEAIKKTLWFKGNRTLCFGITAAFWQTYELVDYTMSLVDSLGNGPTKILNQTFYSRRLRSRCLFKCRAKTQSANS